MLSFSVVKLMAVFVWFGFFKIFEHGLKSFREVNLKELVIWSNLHSYLLLSVLWLQDAFLLWDTYGFPLDLTQVNWVYLLSDIYWGFVCVLLHDLNYWLLVSLVDGWRKRLGGWCQGLQYCHEWGKGKIKKCSE